MSTDTDTFSPPRSETSDRSARCNTWYLVQCKPRECERGEEHLTDQGFPVFLPRHSVQRKKNRRIVWQQEPLFPHYLFLHAYPQCNWAAIRSTRGVCRVVSFNGAPLAVEEEIVLGLRHQCALLNGLEPEPVFKAGARVVITEGCFKELEAIVQTTQGDERVVLLLNMMNRSQRVELPMSSVTCR